MKKTALKKPNKTVISSAIIIIVTLLVGALFIYRPFLSKKTSLRASILYERDRNVLAGRIRALGKHLKVYEKRIPEQGRGVSWLLGKVSEMATEEDIEISSIKPGAPEDRDLCTKLYVVLDTVSTYDNLGRFISSIESDKKFLRVESIDIKRLDLDEGFDKETSSFKSFDAKAHIVITTVVFKE